MDRLKLLIVEDDPLFGEMLKEAIEDAGYLPRLVMTGAAALESVAEEGFALVLQDVKLPDADGLQVLREILISQPHCGALVMTGHGNIETAVEAMKIGAFDFLTKPFSMDTLFLKMERFLELKRMDRQAFRARRDGNPFSAIITRSPAMLAAMNVAATVARTDVPLLLQGESGTGKDLVVSAVHKGSQRRTGPYIAVNCAAIPASLLESELFGVEKGAYTGADRARPGYLEMAAAGTLFLDEIGELPLNLQGKLLRALEEKKVARIGGTSFKHLDFRLICATNRNLMEMVEKGEFRKDLFFRIDVVPITLPPLRERKEDIPLLLAHYLQKLGERFPEQVPEFTPEALECLYEYTYPGNVRELVNIVERIFILYPEEKIRIRHLPQEVQKPMVTGNKFESFPIGKPLKDAVLEYEKRYIEKVMSRTGGRKAETARILGLSRKALWEKMKSTS